MSFFKSKPIDIIKKSFYTDLKSKSCSPPSTSPIRPTVPLSKSYQPEQKILKKSSNVEVYITESNGVKKVVKKTIWNETHKRCYIFNELDALQTISSPYVPKIYGFHTSLDSQYVWMEIECIDGVDLHQLILPKKGTDVSNIHVPNMLEVMKQLAQGLMDIHQASFVHGDIKPENIMISEGPKITFIDFGFSCPINPLLPSGKYFRGSIPYMYPQMYQQKCKPDDYTPELLKKNDIYGLANVFYFLVKSHPIHKILPHDNYRTYMERVLRTEPNPDTGYPTLDLLIHMMIHQVIDAKGVVQVLEYMCSKEQFVIPIHRT
jgi:serine/threonine protein kinase